MRMDRTCRFSPTAAGQTAARAVRIGRFRCVGADLGDGALFVPRRSADRERVFAKRCFHVGDARSERCDQGAARVLDGLTGSPRGEDAS